MKRILPLIALAVCADAARAGSLIVQSSGPSASALRPGALLREGKVIDLKPGDRLSLLDERGTKLVIGPARIVVSANSSKMVASLADIEQGRLKRRPALGGMRLKNPPPPPPRPPELWQFDVAGGGRICVLAGMLPTFWRSAASRDETLTITRDAYTLSLSWKSGEAVLAWPPAMPIIDGSAYQIARNSSAPVAVTVRIAPAGDLVVLARALAEARCDTQLDLLLANDQ